MSFIITLNKKDCKINTNTWYPEWTHPTWKDFDLWAISKLWLTKHREQILLQQYGGELSQHFIKWRKLVEVLTWKEIVVEWLNITT